MVDGEWLVGVAPGRIDARQVDARRIAQRASFYVCGPPAMARSVIDGLLARGVPRHDIFSEAFSLAPDTAPTAALGRSVHFARSGVRRAVWSEADTSLLPLAERMGVALAGGCRVGRCKTCRVGVRAGQVWHRGSTPPLAPDECFACIAVPVTDLEVDA